MLRRQKRHISFHTPGHKRAGWDITELSYSDNLSAPTGAIARAQQDLSRICGASKSFILTDGSTCGVHSMLYALHLKGLKRVAVSPFSHLSIRTGLALSGLEEVSIAAKREAEIPLQPTCDAMEAALSKADALLLTSPDYYGNFPDLKKARELCDRYHKPLLIDGAHGSHLVGSDLYAGNFADLWVDGAHKSLPTLTQGALVSAKGEWAELLEQAVPYFRTTSPSYPIMASVEHGYKVPQNEKIEEAAQRLKRELNAYPNADWSKLVVCFGTFSKAAQDYLEDHGIYPEFNDGNYLMFYFSPCTTLRELKKLKKILESLPRGELIGADHVQGKTGKTATWVPLSKSLNTVCATACGIFPPCLPLVLEGEHVTAEAIARLASAKSTFGLRDGKIHVYTEGACESCCNQQLHTVS
jgi:arginine/lysine/ornithine decarboxylase